MGKRVKVALLSCGLGHVNRGFEISTARWYEALKEHPGLDVKLYCGGRYPEGHWVWNLRRDGVLNIPFRHFPFLNQRRRWEFSYGAEQVSFGFSFIVESLKWDPDVVWTKEAPMVHVIDSFRKLFRLKWKIVFANGGPFKPRTVASFHCLQQLQPDSYREAIEYGIPAERMRIIPNCVGYRPPARAPEQTRRRYGFAEDDYLVISVAAWNRYHKRIDYLIEEIAGIGDRRVKLVLCGQRETETDALERLAQRLLPGRVFWLTLPPDEVFEVLHACDLFVLASLNEGLGMAAIEAAMAGLPVICHPHGGSRYILRDPYWLRDLSQPGALAAIVQSTMAEGFDRSRLAELTEQARSRFSEEALVGQFYDMVRSLVEPKEGSTPQRAADKQRQPA